MRSLDPEARQRAVKLADHAGELHPPIRTLPPSLVRAARELLRMKPAR